MSAPRPYVTDSFYPLSQEPDNRLLTQLDSEIEAIYIYIYDSVLAILTVWYQVWYGTYHRTAHALVPKHTFQSSEPLLRSFCVPYGSCWCLLAQNVWHLRICNC